MPYIKKADRNKFEIGPEGATAGLYFEAETAGELNYCFTQLALAYLKANGESYQSYNDIVGAIEGAKLELYRRRVAHYEDTKIQENGDVY